MISQNDFSFGGGNRRSGGPGAGGWAGRIRAARARATKRPGNTGVVPPRGRFSFSDVLPLARPLPIAAGYSNVGRIPLLNAPFGGQTRLGFGKIIANKAMGLSDDDDSSSWLDQFGGILKDVTSAYGQYTQAQATKNQSDLNLAKSKAQLEMQRKMASFGPISGLSSGSTFGVPNSVLMLAAAGGIAYLLFKRK